MKSKFVLLSAIAIVVAGSVQAKELASIRVATDQASSIVSIAAYFDYGKNTLAPGILVNVVDGWNSEDGDTGYTTHAVVDALEMDAATKTVVARTQNGDATCGRFVATHKELRKGVKALVAANPTLMKKKWASDRIEFLGARKGEYLLVGMANKYFLPTGLCSFRDSTRLVTKPVDGYDSVTVKYQDLDLMIYDTL